MIIAAKPLFYGKIHLQGNYPHALGESESLNDFASAIQIFKIISDNKPLFLCVISWLVVLLQIPWTCQCFETLPAPKLSLLHFLSHVLGKLPTLLHVFQNSGHKHLDAEEKTQQLRNLRR